MLFSVLKKGWALFSALIMALTVLTSPKAYDGEDIQLVSTDTFVLEKALIMGQGITTDGEYYYTSGAISATATTAIAKFTFEDMEYVDCNFMAIPFKLMAEGFDHIGGISLYNGKIYAASEGGEKKDGRISCIMVFDAETLDFTGEYYYLSPERFPTGVPWCAVDPATGYLYASIWDNADKVYVYDVNDEMRPVKEIDVNGCVDSLSRIQGAEFYNGTLYLSQDTKNDAYQKTVFSMDIDTGEVQVAFKRPFSDNHELESEGMTIWYNEKDGSLLHTLDYNKLVGVSVHHYKVDL